jgi:hypothetical protein
MSSFVERGEHSVSDETPKPKLEVVSPEELVADELEFRALRRTPDPRGQSRATSRLSAASMAKKPPAPIIRGRFVCTPYYDEEGRIFYEILYDAPPAEPACAPWKPTLKQKMMLAIIQRVYQRRTIPDIATVTERIGDEWPGECARRKIKEVKPGQYDPSPPRRDTVARTLRVARLIE